jgi:hypothetical protein
MSYNHPYIVRNMLYSGLFPREWAEYYIEGTGPEKCLNCYSYGMISGCFAMYCTNCASLYDNYERGYGVIDSFLENTNILNYSSEKSAYNTYLKNINFKNLVELKDIVKYRQSIIMSDILYKEVAYDVLNAMLEHNSYSQSMLYEYELNTFNIDADDEDDEAYNEYMMEKKLNQMTL